MKLINENLMQIDADLNTKDEILYCICNLLDGEDRLADRDVYLEDVYERETLEPTALGFSFAVPHAKSKGVKTASLTFISLKNEVLWTDTDKVKYIFGIAVPHENEGNEHLKILAMLARKMVKEAFRDGLNAARTKENYLSLIMPDAD